MAYTRNWDESQPQDHTKLSDVPPWMRTIKIDVAQRLKDWIYGFISGETKIGLKKAPLHPVSSDPATESDKGILYVKEVDGVKELFYKDSGGNVKQITKEGKINCDTGWWAAIPVVGNDGVMEIGKFIDFHLSADSTADYEPRLAAAEQDLELWNSNGHYKIWHSGNDGSGSGLDADLLRGLPADFTCSKNQNGYTKLPNGLILQWGYTSPSHTNVTLPVTFPNKGLVVLVTNVDSQGSGVDNAFGHFVNNSTIYVATKAEDFGGGGAITNFAVYWIAIGY